MSLSAWNCFAFQQKLLDLFSITDVNVCIIYLLHILRKKQHLPKKKQVKKAILLKKWMFIQYFVFPSPFLYYDLSFDMQKPSHVTNIHWKFHDFFPSSLGAIKVLHFTVRSEDGVRTHLPKTDVPSLMVVHWKTMIIVQNFVVV